MTIVIAGAGLAGLRTAQEVRKLGYDGEVVLVGDENHLPYDRPPLSKEVIRGERDDTTFETEDYFTEHKIDLRLGSPVASAPRSTTTISSSRPDCGRGSWRRYPILRACTYFGPATTPKRCDAMPPLRPRRW